MKRRAARRAALLIFKLWVFHPETISNFAINKISPGSTGPICVVTTPESVFTCPEGLWCGLDTTIQKWNNLVGPAIICFPDSRTNFSVNGLAKGTKKAFRTSEGLFFNNRKGRFLQNCVINFLHQSGIQPLEQEYTFAPQQ
jgi:hypothetical protein